MHFWRAGWLTRVEGFHIICSSRSPLPLLWGCSNTSSAREGSQSPSQWITIDLSHVDYLYSCLCRVDQWEQVLQTLEVLKKCSYVIRRFWFNWVGFKSTMYYLARFKDIHHWMTGGTKIISRISYSVLGFFYELLVDIKSLDWRRVCWHILQ